MRCQEGGWRVESSTSFIHLAFHTKLKPDVTGVCVCVCLDDGNSKPREEKKEEKKHVLHVLVFGFFIIQFTLIV